MGSVEKIRSHRLGESGVSRLSRACNFGNDDGLTSWHRDEIFDVCSELLVADNRAALHACIAGRLQDLLGFRSCIIGFGDDLKDGIVPRVVVSHEFPLQYLEHISTDGVIRPFTYNSWRLHRMPLSVSFDEEMLKRLPAKVSTTVRHFGCSELLFHGQSQPSGQLTSYAAFNQVEGGVRDIHCRIIAHVMPHLHACLLKIGTEPFGATPLPCKALKGPAEPCKSGAVVQADESTGPVAQFHNQRPDKDFLSERRKQILYLLGLGKTNWEISKILCTSVDNVKYHIKHLNMQFDTNSRTALVAEVGRRRLLPKAWPGV